MARILVVDDNRDTADSFAVLLKLWGHETRRAYDGESVLQQALAFLPQVILLDIGLPKMDGYEVAKRLRQFQQLAGVRIAAITGHVTAADVQKCKDFGFDWHFSKPIDTEALRSYLEEVK
jgi:CheY-like chemotaxis protein